jgi:pyrimidine deaminase RibD-like protein
MNLQDFRIHNTKKLDILLFKCLRILLQKQKEDGKYWGRVAACVLDNNNNVVFGVNYLMPDGTRCHAERAALDAYNKKYGEVPSGSIILTTLSPCSQDMDERWGSSCTEVINDSGIHKVYCGYEDPTQNESDSYLHKQFHVRETRNPKLRKLCKNIADTFLND